jgi:hypothetical protein
MPQANLRVPAIVPARPWCTVDGGLAAGLICGPMGGPAHAPPDGRGGTNGRQPSA